MRRDQRLLRILGRVARGVLLVLTLMALATAGIWRWQPRLVDRVDAYWTNRRSNDYSNRFYVARRLVREDSASGAGMLEEIIGGLESVQRGDRLYQVKRDSVQLLTDVLANDEQWQRAATWCQRWMEWDEKDISAREAFALACMHLADRASEGRAELAALFDKIPESQSIASAYVDSLVEGGQAADAFSSIRQFLRLQQNRFAGQCEFMCARNALMEKLQASPFHEIDGTWRWTVELERGAGKIHIRLPEFEIAAIRHPRLVIWNSTTDENVVLAGTEAELIDSIRRDGGTWTIPGQDPDAPVSPSNAFASWIVPEDVPAERLYVSFVGEVVPRYPVWIARDLCLPKFSLEQFVSDAAAQADPNLVDDFRSLRTDVLQQSRIGLAWRSSGLDRSEWTTLGGVMENARIQFDVRFPVDELKSDPRLQLPAISGAVYDFSKIELGDGQTAIEFDPEALQIVSGLEKTAAALRVTADPAIVSLALPDDLDHVDWVRVEGSVE